MTSVYRLYCVNSGFESIEKWTIYGTESEEVPQKGILIFITSIQVLNNESFFFLLAGSP